MPKESLVDLALTLAEDDAVGREKEPEFCVVLLVGTNAETRLLPCEDDEDEAAAAAEISARAAAAEVDEVDLMVLLGWVDTTASRLRVNRNYANAVEDTSLVRENKINDAAASFFCQRRRKGAASSCQRDMMTARGLYLSF